MSGNQIHLNQLSALTNQGIIYESDVPLNAKTIQNQGKISGGIRGANKR
ncbi:hypothetical protein P9J70_11510 [Glaesserella parasuis]|nr:hypothetical protein [Glaesserella parasuis]MCT8824875.1 hypothetical protein [Glaesserella parasuis]MDD2166792.1 hypothetical protein [Glaesserella parasuis]MDG6232093.1 hypothetical protein [Glaesserella parasuis]MWQ15587.1 hypothetical protein [Glaesserella parasuis]